jgi:hypothetical protein
MVALTAGLVLGDVTVLASGQDLRNGRNVRCITVLLSVQRPMEALP